MKSLALSTLLGLTILAVAITGCTTAEQDLGLSDEEIALFEQKLASGASPQEACDELEVLCGATGFGCKAHAVFCNVPTKAYICQQLAAACVGYPAACDVYNDHCKGSGPSADTGPYPTDAGPPKLDWGYDDARYSDMGPIPVDAGPYGDAWYPSFEAGPVADTSGPYFDAGSYYPDAMYSDY